MKPTVEQIKGIHEIYIIMPRKTQISALCAQEYYLWQYHVPAPQKIYKLENYKTK